MSINQYYDQLPRKDRRPEEVARKVQHFFRYWAINRHKSTVLTPAVHLSSYNPDDNRHDLRPFLLVVDWPWQFACPIK